MMKFPFERNKKTRPDINEDLLGDILPGLSIDGPTIVDADDTFGPLGLNTLFVPSEPLVDLIFVHGLQGGSRKTWSSSKNVQHFWPKEWLPKDPGFRHARIHSFGYRSDWIDPKASILNIDHIAETLLASIQSSPSFKELQSAKIIFVAHSMGGLVAKKAIIEAHNNFNYVSISTRIKGVVFLGTPHKGSESAKAVELFVALSPFHGDKPYVKDLNPASKMLQSINENFSKVSENLRLLSFYETLETWVGTSKMIVTRESAIMGYENEKRISMNKNHRGICKFDSPRDPDFLLLRNSLCRLIEDILQMDSIKQRTLDAEVQQDLKSFFNIRREPEADLIELEEIAFPGSLSWFFDKIEFCQWKGGNQEDMSRQIAANGRREFKVLWVNAIPGGGKSILASQVISHLSALGMDCYYHFFSVDERSNSNVGGLLQSLAYQMASDHLCVRKKIHGLRESGVKLNSNRVKHFWRNVFTECVLKCTITRTQYWIIDALDECDDFDDFLVMLEHATAMFPLCILITSRYTTRIKTRLASLGSKVSIVNITFDDVKNDIRSYVEKGPYAYIVHRESPERRQELIEKILERSEGCFLWIKMVLKELEHAYSTEDLEHTLETLPPGMDKLYTRSLTEIIRTSERGGEVIRVILTIVVCTTRPLTVPELTDAIKMHLGVTLLDHTIKTVCGNLVSIDKAGRVCLVHKTARDFLLSFDLFGTLTPDSIRAHHSLAVICLDFLMSSHMRPLRIHNAPGNFAAQVKRRTELLPFMQYACMHFSDHIIGPSLDDDVVLDKLHTFLTTDGLGWIEHIAASEALSTLIRTSQNLQRFIQVRAEQVATLDAKSEFIRNWSIDLMRVVAKFGKHLLKLPQSIYGLIPPLVPQQTAIASQYAADKGISIAGLLHGSWDDRLCGISLQGNTATAVACGASTFAVGVQNGEVYIYDNVTFQKLGILQHRETVKALKYNFNGRLLVSSGMKRTQLWNVCEKTQVWEVETKSEPLAITFTPERHTLLLITRSNILLEFDATDGKLLKRIVRPFPHSTSGLNLFPGGDITCASFDTTSDLLATVHRGHAIILSDLNNDEEIGRCIPETDHDTLHFDFFDPAVAIAFCPNSEQNLIAAVYRDGGLATFNSDAQGALVETVHHYEVEPLACSPDGRTIAVGDSSGTIILYDADSLRLLDRLVHRSSLAVRAMTFSADSKRLVDIRESQCNVWEPPVLMRADHRQATTAMLDRSQTHEEDETESSEETAEITAMHTTVCGNFVVCGEDDGTVTLYGTETGEKLKSLYQHPTKSWISQIATSTRYVASLAGSNELIIGLWNLHGEHECKEFRKFRFSEPVCQILLDGKGDRLLVVLQDAVVQHDLSADGASRRSSHMSHAVWVTDPSRSDMLFAIRSDSISHHSWDDLSSVSSRRRMSVPLLEKDQLSVKYVAHTAKQRGLGIVLCSRPDPPASTFTSLVDCASFSLVKDKSTGQHVVISENSIKVEHVIGIHHRRLIFLDADLWVCSVALGTETAKCTHHMFIPDEWLRANNRVMVSLTSKGDIVLVKGDGIVIIRRPFTHSIIF